MSSKNIAILGSTGSIGRNALRVIDALNSSCVVREASCVKKKTQYAIRNTQYEIVALSAHSSVEQLAEQARCYKPRFVAITNADYVGRLRKLVSDLDVEVLSGADSLIKIAELEEVDIVLSAVVGATGLPSILAAARSGKRLAIANKEPLVIAGQLLTEVAKENGSIILPVDSEHSAICQAMQSGRHEEVSKIILTASGGPFRKATAQDLQNVTLEQALSHPVWDMGPKITIDSATMMNKAFEVIEAHWLFDMPVEKIEVLIHPESIVHSLVEFVDGSVIAQMGEPDMCLPIQYALTYPVRVAGINKRLRLEEIGKLTFEKPNLDTFRALSLGYDVARTGGTAAVVFNAANEAAVQKFLQGKIKFVNIVELIEYCLNKHDVKTDVSLEELLQADAWARKQVEAQVHKGVRTLRKYRNPKFEYRNPKQIRNSNVQNLSFGHLNFGNLILFRISSFVLRIFVRKSFSILDYAARLMRGCLMSKSKGLFKNLRGFLGVVIFVAIVYLIIRNINVFGNILVVLLGFGAVVLVHEFGHFVVAKLSDIKVEAFSIFMPPTLLGVRKTKDGFAFAILPKLFLKESDESNERRAKPAPSGVEGNDERSLPRAESRGTTRIGETEYRIGLIPFGGFVKMLGQEDVGPVKSSDDPRSFANKPVSTRIPVIAAGVIFNVISAVIIFMIVFLIGIKLLPPVVGGVAPDSPAARAGIKPGDEIIEIAEKSEDLDFSNILVAAALSDEGEEVPLKVRHKDGSQEQIKLVAEYLPGQPLKDFGIYRPLSLTIAEVSNPNSFLEKTGLLPGDRIRRVNGRDVQSYWQMEEIVQNTFASKVAIEAQRADELVRTEIPLSFRFAEGYEVKSESDLSHIYSIVPRLQITSVIEVPETVAESLLNRIKNKFLALFDKVNKRQKDTDKCSALRNGDIIVAINDVEYPTYKEMREVTEQYRDKELPVAVLRKDANGVEEALTVIVVPKRPQGIERTFIGIDVALDFEHSVVAKTIAVEDGKPSLEIPRGATITAVNGVEVSGFYDVVREIRRHSGERITIDYSLNKETSGRANLDTGARQELITIKSTFAESIPFKPLEITYQASGPIDAITMGYRRTVMFIAQTYVTLKRLIGWVVSPKHLMGPVGIIAFSYRVVAERPLIEYIYFLGLINAVIAVFNLLPLPPLDGGLIALLLVEKIKGSALSERTCEVIAYAGWVLIGTLLIYVTFNDIVRVFFS